MSSAVYAMLWYVNFILAASSSSASLLSESSPAYSYTVHPFLTPDKVHRGQVVTAGCNSTS